jgi:hypothetical protein
MQEGQTCVADINCDPGLHCQPYLANTFVRFVCTPIQPFFGPPSPPVNLPPCPPTVTSASFGPPPLVYQTEEDDVTSSDYKEICILAIVLVLLVILSCLLMYCSLSKMRSLSDRWICYLAMRQGMQMLASIVFIRYIYLINWYWIFFRS